MKTHSDVDLTRKELDRLLALVPDKCYSACSTDERKAYDDVSEALKRHRLAVRAARAKV